MKFDLNKSYEIQERTPAVLRSLLTGLDEGWVMNNEGPETFSPYDVMGHLIQGEKTDWPVRVSMILEQGSSGIFVPYDRFAMFEESKGKTPDQLLNEFETLRKDNLQWLRSLKLTESDLDKTGTHPKFGQVTLRQLLATWVVHDLTHLAQITRVMAKQYKEEIGPWLEFFRIMSF
ncbi:MAG: DinB family protein [Bacteroidota bacterium]